MPILVSCAYTIRIHVEIPALKATGSRTFSKVEQSCTDQGQVQSRNCQQMADSCALV